MRRWTFAILFICWCGLSAAAWWLSMPITFEWVTNQLAGRVDSNQVELIATVAANALPFVASAVVVLLAFLLARPTRRPIAIEGAAPEATVLRSPSAAAGARSTLVAASTMPNVAARTTPAATRPLYIKPASTLVNSGARFGVIVRRGGNNAKDRGAQHEQEIYFKRLDYRGTLMAQIPYDRQQTPRLQCFVDYKGLKFECVKRALTASRFTLITPRADRNFRAWFLLPDTKIGGGSDEKKISPRSRQS
jgi:hypothetical protein